MDEVPMRMSDHGAGPGLGEWREEPSSWVDPQQVHVTRIDVPFLELTWFFIKSSLALALAFSVTSWLWVMIATGIASLLAGLLYLVGVPQLVTGQHALSPALSPSAPALVAPAPAPAPVATPPVPEADPAAAAEDPAATPAELQAAPARVDPSGAPVDPDASATEALQREELERLRRERR